MTLGSIQPLTFPGGKGGRCVRLTTLAPSCAVVMKSGDPNFLEPSGPLQACNGTALPLPPAATLRHSEFRIQCHMFQIRNPSIKSDYFLTDFELAST